MTRLRTALQGALAMLVVVDAADTALGYWLPEPWQFMASLGGFTLTWFAVRKGWI